MDEKARDSLFEAAFERSSHEETILGLPTHVAVYPPMINLMKSVFEKRLALVVTSKAHEVYLKGALKVLDLKADKMIASYAIPVKHPDETFFGELSRAKVSFEDMLQPNLNTHRYPILLGVGSVENGDYEMLQIISADVGLQLILYTCEKDKIPTKWQLNRLSGRHFRKITADDW